MNIGDMWQGTVISACHSHPHSIRSAVCTGLSLPSPSLNPECSMYRTVTVEGAVVTGSKPSRCWQSGHLASAWKPPSGYYPVHCTALHCAFDCALHCTALQHVQHVQHMQHVYFTCALYMCTSLHCTATCATCATCAACATCATCATCVMHS